MDCASIARRTGCSADTRPVAGAPRRAGTCVGARGAVGALLLALLAGAAGVAGCEADRPRRAESRPVVVRDVPDVLRNLVRSEATLLGTDAVLVSGLGVVVGLDETGGGPYPEPVQETMERELAKGGVGRGGAMSGSPLGSLTPKQFLADRRTAVVIVEGVIAAGAPRGAEFDVVVRPLPGSAVTSLQGGRLWTTELRQGVARTFRSSSTPEVATADGPLFLNPFADQAPGSAGAAAGGGGAGGAAPTPGTPTGGAGSLIVARVLGGGRVTQPATMELVLDNPSHARVSSIVSALNTRFPQGPGDANPTARGRNDQIIAINVPGAWRERAADFVQVLRAMRTDVMPPVLAAQRYAQEIQNQPSLAEDLAWCLIALGRPALQFVTPMYDSGELSVRMAALRVGAELGDPRAAGPLVSIAQGQGGAASLPVAVRARALSLVGRLAPDPRVDESLRALLDADELDLRVAAYEALDERRDPFISRTMVGAGQRRVDSKSPGARFRMDVVPSAKPMVYVKQQAEARLVIFGEGQRVIRPSILSMWDNRLTINADESDRAAASGTVQLFYRDFRTGKAVQRKVPDELTRLIRFLGHATSTEEPDPGLGLTYSEVVGVVYQLSKQKVVAAAFTTEAERLLGRLADVTNATAVMERPVGDADRDAKPVQRVGTVPPGPSAAGGAQAGAAPVPGAAPASAGPELPAGVVPVAPRKKE